MTCGHRKCRYRDNTAGCCEFILIEGHSRGCKPEKCQKWRTRNADGETHSVAARQLPKRGSQGEGETEEKKRKRYDDAEALRMWVNGDTDKEIADKLGVSRETIIGWRKKRGLRSHKKVRI